jgi:DNA invertase Pin-like site-specific DNA recombinase
VLYIRQSITRRKKDRDGRTTAELDTVSPELQETAGRDYGTRMGYEIVGIVTDLNRTGRTLKRRKVQEAIGFIERGQAQIVIVWKWSRLSRNRRDFAITCDVIEGLGGRVESSTEPADTSTAVGRLSRGMLAEFATFESDRVGEIIKEVQDGRVAQGLPGNGKDRFGYRNVDKRFIIDPTTGPVLAEMYRRYIGGTGYTTIATWLNDHGYTTTYGKHFRPETVGIVLRSGFGAGLIRHRGELLPGIHEPVITEAEWKRFQAISESRSGMSSRAKASPYLLSGLLRCGACGYSINTSRDSAGTVWYRCQARTILHCTNGYAKVELVEREVHRWLAELVDDVDAAAEASQREQERLVVVRNQATSLARRIADQDKALGRLTVDRAHDLVPEAAYEIARDEIMGVRSRLAAELADAERQASVGPQLDVPAYRGLLAEWHTLPLESRREMLRRVIRRVRVWGKPARIEVEPTWAVPSHPGEMQ